jgi:WW domain-containing oxidoreductase
MALDLGDPGSVRAFAAAFQSSRRPLHCLVNNAGANFWNAAPFYTSQGIGGCAQVNFLGCYTLTRLLEGCLLASAPSRVVTVSSVMHRTGTLRFGATRFLREWRCGTYSDAKLAQVLFTYELDRRLGGRGVRACIADPGAVQTEIWRATPLRRPGVKAVMDQLYAPPREGAQTVIHAATCDMDEAEQSWNKTCAAPDVGGLAPASASDAASQAPADATGKASVPRPSPRSTHREPGRLYFARGLFAGGPVTADGWLPQPLWKGAALLCSVMDQPLRRATCGTTTLAGVRPVKSSPESYDRLRARELWNAAADVAGLPQEA